MTQQQVPKYLTLVFFNCMYKFTVHLHVHLVLSSFNSINYIMSIFFKSSKLINHIQKNCAQAKLLHTVFSLLFILLHFEEPLLLHCV